MGFPNERECARVQLLCDQSPAAQPQQAGGVASLRGAPELGDRAIRIDQMILAQHRHRPPEANAVGGVVVEVDRLEQVVVDRDRDLTRLDRSLRGTNLRREPVRVIDDELDACRLAWPDRVGSVTMALWPSPSFTARYIDWKYDAAWPGLSHVSCVVWLTSFQAPKSVTPSLRK